jgi:hypothetical protein
VRIPSLENALPVRCVGVLSWLEGAVAMRGGDSGTQGLSWLPNQDYKGLTQRRLSEAELEAAIINSICSTTDPDECIFI